MKTENTALPPIARFDCEESIITDDNTGEDYIQYVPVLLSPLCSPVRFALYHADRWDVENQRIQKAAAMRSALESFRLMAENITPPPILENRALVWKFTVDGAFVRWCGALDQFKADYLAYCDRSPGTWENVTKTRAVFRDSVTGQRTVFQAVKN